MRNIDKDEIERQLDEEIEQITLLKETSCSWLYHVKGMREYVLKQSKRKRVDHIFANHKTIYECWFREKEDVGFKIPKVYLLSSDRSYYLMEYMKGGINLLEVLLRGKEDANEIFRRAGRYANQYHKVMTKYLAEHKESILEHNTIRQILESRDGNKIRRRLQEFGDDSYRIIFKDLTPSNIVLDQSNDIYFLDFPTIYYYAPFYYDLARLIDTTKVFSLVRKPWFFVANSKEIRHALKCFLEGYGDLLDGVCLKKMQYVHRKEHIQMKRNESWFDSVVLRGIYGLI